ncbi:archease [Nanoarchaeota archaeon]
MEGYEFLEHTADVKFRAYGKTLEEAFKNSAYALADTITDHKKVLEKTEKKIVIESGDKKALLYDFLEEFLVLVDTEEFLLSKIKDLRISEGENEWKLIAKVIGDKVDDKYEIGTHIKAVTYQQMEIKQSRERYTIQVVLDI